MEVALAEPAVDIINGDGEGRLLLICEHASNSVPASIELGVSEHILSSHSAWDPGALEVARRLSERFDSPLVASRISRLVYDCNRPPHSPTAIVENTEYEVVPGNQNLTASQRQERVDLAYLPFKSAVEKALSGFDTKAVHPVMITIHSFTPEFKGKRRDVELGILHDSDSRLADAMLEQAGVRSKMKICRNQPYTALDGVTHTLCEHALPGELLNAMIEIRNDLLRDDESVLEISELLGDLIEHGMKACSGLRSGTA
ncbi:MAG: N-formylglutamate amidohydrolase [Granulosicoccus sp.]